MDIGELVKALGPTGGVVIVVMFFLRHLQGERKAQAARDQENNDRAAAREEELRSCIRGNTAAFNNLSQVLLRSKCPYDET